MDSQLSVECKCLGNMGRGDVKVEDHCGVTAGAKLLPETSGTF